MIGHFISIAIFILALGIRIAALWIHGRDIAFIKYPKAAQLISEGTLSGAPVLDFSPLYLDLHRLALYLGTTSLDGLRLFQCCCGALMCVIIYWIGAKLFNRTTGMWAGVFAACQQDLVIYAQVFEPEQLLLLLCALAIWLLVAAPMKKPWLRQILLGICIGLAIATRPTAWQLVPIVLLAPIALFKKLGPTAFLKQNIVFFCALGVILTGLSLRNHSFSSSPVMSPWQVFYTGNNPLATGLWRDDFLIKDLEYLSSAKVPDSAHQVFRDVALIEGASPEAPDRYWLKMSLAYIFEYPGRFLQLVGEKFLAIGQAHTPHDVDTVFRLERRLNKWPLLNASMIVPFGLLGLIAWRKKLWLVCLLVLSQAGICLIFFVSARYRLLLLPWFCLGASLSIGLLCATVRGILRKEKKHDTLNARRASLGLIVFVLLFHLPLPPGYFESKQTELRRESHLLYRKASQLRREDKLEQASQELKKCFYLIPWSVRLLPISRVPFPLRKFASELVPSARKEVTKKNSLRSWVNLGFILDFAGRRQAAITALNRAEELVVWPGQRPLHYLILIRLGKIHLALAQMDDAQRAFARAVDLLPGSPEALVGLAISSPAKKSGIWLEKALKVNPRLLILYLHGRMMLDAGLEEKSINPLAELVKLLPNYARGKMLYAVALAHSGKFEDAVKNVIHAQKSASHLYDPEYRPLELLHQAALQAAPAQIKAWKRLATFAELYGDYTLAVTAWNQLEKISPLSPKELIRLAWLYLRHERAALAIPRFQQALLLDPQIKHGLTGLELAKARIPEQGR